MKIAVSIILFTLAFSTAEAQLYDKPLKIFTQDDEKTFHGGVTLGANISEVIGDGYHGFHKLGLQTGAAVVGKVQNRVWGVSVELLYSQKGSRGVRTINSVYVGEMYEKYFLDLNYVELPVQALIFLRNKPVYLGAGLSYSRLVSSREEITSDQPINIDLSQYPFFKEDWCALASINYQFWRGWYVRARYSQSVKSIRGYVDAPLHLGFGSQYNMYFTFSVSYLIP